ncbi:ROK family protein [Paenibacillus sambharensis]|uniref:ROK family protein n=1 Tax=Paenibacillus sambharensis TaxID=1803190 RepID=A0A2W1LLS4_9BACL|nr:ROK family protein [Paenibacillus sambharensis]PZD95825.1 ROK family protein [Paenibacillus sambharensis]
MQKSTGDAALIKKINTAIVLECVLTHAPLSRAQISEKTGLNKATVSSLVQDLIASHLVLEIGMGESSGGRKPVMLLFNSQAGYAVGIDLGVNYIRGVLTDLRGEIIHERRVKLPGISQEEVLPRLSESIRSLISSAPASPYGVIGIGIGVPGIVDDSGTILFAPNLEWELTPLSRLVEEEFKLPVTIDNEANAGAQGEQKYGAGRGIAHQIYVSVGIGIGTGIIINKELYKGASGFSGELGHLSISLEGKQCRCGNKGCWELYASENALLELAAPLGFESMEAVLAEAEAGNPEVLQLLSQTGQYLGIGIANIVNVFNPDAVIIGNTMSLAGSWIGEAVRETVARRTLPYHRSGMQILFAEQQERSAVRGAAYYAISRFFERVKGGLEG